MIADTVCSCSQHRHSSAASVKQRVMLLLLSYAHNERERWSYSNSNNLQPRTQPAAAHTTEMACTYTIAAYNRCEQSGMIVCSIRPQASTCVTQQSVCDSTLCATASLLQLPFVQRLETVSYDYTCI